MLKAIRRRMTYANTAATLALFLALGGVSWAAASLPANSVGTKQIRDGAVTLVKISRDARSALHGARGPRGPAGPAGADAVKYFAYVARNGTLQRGSRGVTSTFASGSLNYAVIFPSSVAACVAEVTPANRPLGSGSSTSQVLVSAAIGHEYTTTTPTNVVRVTLSQPGGTAAQAPFYLAVFC